MAKIRVYELSKELGVENKDLVDFLQSKQVEIKGHMSSISEEDAKLAREYFAKNTETPAKQEEKTAEPKKKKIIRVVHPSNAQHGQRRGGLRDRNRRPGGRGPAGNRPERIPQDDVLPGMVRTRGGIRTAGTVRSSDVVKEEERRKAEAAKRAAAAKKAAEEAAVKAAEVKVAEEQAAAEAAAKAAEEKAAEEKAAAEAATKAAEEKAAEEAAAKAAEEKTTAEAEVKVEEEKKDQEKDTNVKASLKNAKEGNTKRESDRSGSAGVQRSEHRDGDRRDGTRRDGARRDDARRDGTRRDGARRDGTRRDGDRRDGDRDNRSRNGGDRGNDRGRGNQGRDGQGRDNRKRLNIPSAPDTGSSQKQAGKDAYQKKKGRRDQQKTQENERFSRKNSNKPGAFHKPVKVEKKKEEEQIKMITVPATITIQELADKMKIQPSVIVKKLFMKGTMVTINQEIEYSMAEEIALEFDVLCEQEKAVDYIEELLKEDDEDESKMVKRPPVVCVMGHVDHGKTSLLDAIRHTNVTDKEAGGITQHIGAYVVTINGENITFLDTPGHEAFTSMRMRGAQSTDIAILVVAADDGVMPQTVEAINHAKAAGIEIIVAINKIDKPGANPDRVKQELSEYELIPEDWGGKTICVPVSAKTGEGLDTLLEMVILTAEMLEFKADPNRTARGLVLEAQLDKGRGPVATVLVQKGTLHVGDPVAAGIAYGKVRAMVDDKGRRVKEAGPSKPVEILGLNDVPGAGDVFIAPKTEREARNFAETFIAQSKLELVNENKSKLKMSLDDLYAQIQEGNLKELDLIVKADVQGSVEAVRQSLEKLSNDEVVVKVIHGGVGAISESDVSLAAASNAVVIGFNVRPDATAKETAEREGVDIRLYRVIYNAIEDVEAAMKGMLEPDIVEEVIGHAQVRQIFHASGVGTIAGSYVKDGIFQRDCQARIVRDGVVVYEGALASLRRFKDDVKEVRSGFECGFVFENFNDVKEGDEVEAFKMVEVARG